MVQYYQADPYQEAAQAQAQYQQYAQAVFAEQSYANEAAAHRCKHLCVLSKDVARSGLDEIHGQGLAHPQPFPWKEHLHENPFK